MKRSASDSDLLLSSNKRYKTTQNQTLNFISWEQEKTLLLQRISYLEKQVKSNKTQQLEKSKLQNFLNTLLETELSNDVLVDITFNENDNNLIVHGRPPVLGSARKQMRYVTPYSFITELIKSKLKSTNIPKFLLDKLTESLIIFLHSDKGIYLTKETYENLKLEKNIYHFSVETIKDSIKQTYYLINHQQLEEYHDNFKGFIDEESQNSYVARKKKFIKFALNFLMKSIQDQNTYNIACEALSRFILTLFNQKPHTSFPEEGNTLNYEIRLYSSPEDAQKPRDKKFKIISSDEIIQKINEGHKEKINKSIIIVNPEGHRVIQTIEALHELNNIVNLYNKSKLAKFSSESITPLNEKIEIYNSRYNTESKLIGYNSSILIHYNQNLTFEHIAIQTKYHIAKHLYSVFDFKPLEPNVFVPSSPLDSEAYQLDVFPSAKANYTEKYCIQDGRIYREQQKKSAIGYNSQAIFRQEGKNAELLTLLAEKILDHVYISLSPFTFLIEGFDSDTNYLLVNLEAFKKIIITAYDIKEEDNFDSILKQQENWDNFEKDWSGSEDSKAIGGKIKDIFDFSHA